MQIHHLEVVRSEHYVLDDDLGVVRRREQALQQSSVDRIVHEGATYEVQPDGSFIVPDDLGRLMLSRPNWHPGPSPLARPLVAASADSESAPAPARTARPRAKADA